MDIKDVENLANLARIELTEEEKSELLHDMDSILGYIKQIEEVKVDVQHSGLNIINCNVWREDLPVVVDGEESFSKEFITEQFPDSQDGFLKVKNIL
ncbi:Asp-tRNA(Asn)/Glu-tRNA(Gln) amidotransferase subunit GatC [Patescibacteria group bacterium]|nr:Asp-tRNA(Asn)/Glu-tRNA(Gln) amidotransferase subunit GatC [Patescibacteria group bacterium]